MNIKTGYKQTEIGVIPEDWEVTNLGSVCNESMQNGVFFKPSNKGFGIKIINVGDLYKTSPIDIDSLELFNASNSEKERFRVKDGDLFFTRSSVVPSGIAHCNMYQSNQDESVVFDSHVIRVRLNKRKIISSFLFRFCISATARNYLISHAKTGTMTTIDQNVLAKCPVYLPSIKEQTAIATALSDIDALIGELDKLIAKKQGIKQATMQQLLTGKKRLAGFSGAWEVKRLGELLDYEQPTKYLVSSTEYNDHNNVAVLTAGKSFVLGYTNEEHGIFQNLPVIIFDDFTTTSKYVDFPFKVKSSAMKMLKPKNEQVNLKFLFEKIQTIRFLLNDHKRYWISEYQKLEIELPTIEEQTAIATILSDMDAEINALQQKRDKTAQLKQGMMQELLTGRIRLNPQESTQC